MTEQEEIMQKQYDRLIAARNYHYDNLNKWLMSFYVIIGALFVAFYKLYPKDIAIVIAILGYLVSLAALLSGKGYSYWETNWILLLQGLERKVIIRQNERVYSVMADKEANNDAMNPISGANVSTTKVALLITSIITVSWGVIAICMGIDMLGWLERMLFVKIGIGLVISAIVSWLLMWAGSKRLHSDIDNLGDLKHPRNEKIMETKENKTNPKRERNLKIVFWILGGVILIMLLVFILAVGRHGNLSSEGNDYANFSTYIGAIGTMLFTALYAYAFIQLQGAVNNNTQAQIENNNIIKQEERDRNNKKNLVVLVSILESSINACLEQLKAVKPYYKEKQLSDANYSTLSIHISQALGNTHMIKDYYINNGIHSSQETYSLFITLIEEVKNNIEQCINLIEKWHKEGHDVTIPSSVRELLTKSSICSQRMERLIISSML